MEVKGLQLLNTLKHTENCSVLTWQNIMWYIVFMWRKVFSGSMVNGLRARLPGNRGSIPELPKFSVTCSWPLLQNTKPLVQCIPRCLPPVVRWLAFKADNLNPHGAKVKKSLSCTSLYSHTIHLFHAFLTK